MRTDFDPLRDAPLPDSFDRTAAWLRATPPPRASPARPLLFAVALAALVGACALPVETEAVVGWAVEATAADGRALVRALDDAVDGVDRLSAEIAPTAAPGDGVEVVRYVVATADAAGRAEDAARRADARTVRTAPVDVAVRQPLGLAAARWLGVQATPRVSDADLQAALDRAFAGQRFSPRVERGPDGQRALVLPGSRLDGLDPDTRIARSGSVATISGGDLGGLSVGGVPLGRLRGADEAAVRAALDSALAAGGAVGARVEVLDGDLRARLDSLGVDLSDLPSLPGADSAVTRGFFVRFPDSTFAP